jgi:hypothetical protein
MKDPRQLLVQFYGTSSIVADDPGSGPAEDVFSDSADASGVLVVGGAPKPLSIARVIQPDILR